MLKLGPHLELHKSRLETLCVLIVSMINARTVNLSHLASEFPSKAKIDSCYRRLQRFFQHADLAEDWPARLIIRLLGLHGKWMLCLDRTHWKVGHHHLNILVLAVTTKRHRVPLMWSVLGKAGNSSTEERIALMKRYLDIFGARTIKVLLADREFIGVKWLKFLNEQEVPFTIRVKENLRVIDEDGACHTLSSLLKTCRGRRLLTATLGTNKSEAQLLLNFAARRPKGGELMIVVCNHSAHDALMMYRKRWAIESLFGDAKTRGLNLEDTRLTEDKKLDLLFGLVAMALTWVSSTGSTMIGTGKIKKKSHGYRAKSIFRIGFNLLRRLLKTNPEEAVRPWDKIPAKN